MSRAAGKSSKVYVNEHNLSGRSSGVEMSVDVNLPPVSCFEDDADEFVEGQYAAKVVQNSFFDGDDGEIDANVWAEIAAAADALLGVYLGNSAAQAASGYELEAQPDDQARPIEVAGAVLLNVTWQANGPVVRSTVLSNVSVVATGVVSGSAQNIGATAAGERFVAILRVLSVTGSGSIVVKVEESSDNAVGDAYAELIAFTTATAVTSERKTTIAATEAWKRVNVTTFSGFTAATIMVVVGKEQGVA